MKGFNVAGKVVFCCLALMIAAPAAAGVSENARSFIEGGKRYDAGDYRGAMERFEAIADSGVVNGKLFYNLANACFKEGELGRAILWYERAAKLLPRDPDLAFNHAYATSFVKDRKEESSGAIAAIIFFWKDWLSERAVKASAIALNFLFWGILAIALFLKNRSLKLPAILVLLPAMVLTLTACYDTYRARFVREGVILPEKAAVRSGLSAESTELFRLHSGTRIIIQQEKETHFRIYFEKGKIGWILKSEIGII